MKYFTQNGNQYTMKRQMGFSLVVIIAMGAAAIAGLFVNKPALTWICGIMTILFILAVALKRVVIDMDRKEIYIKNGLFAPGFSIQFTDFISFQLASVRQSFITTNASLNILYTKNGKEKTAGIAEGFTVRGMQQVLNEVEEIMYSDGHPGKI